MTTIERPQQSDTEHPIPTIEGVEVDTRGADDSEFEPTIIRGRE